MSLQRFDAPLEGYSRQVWPEGLDELNKAYGDRNLCGQTLDHLGRSVPGYTHQDRPTTPGEDLARAQDHYDWFWALNFKFGNDKVAVLFPWKQDWDKKDGSQTDRSISTYVDGSPEAEEHLDRIVLDLTRRLGMLAVPY